MKKLLSVIMAVALVLSLATVAFAAGMGVQVQVQEIDANTMRVEISAQGDKNSRLLYTYPQELELVEANALLPEDLGITDLSVDEENCTISFAWATYEEVADQELLEVVLEGKGGNSYETTLSAPETGEQQTVLVSVPYRFVDVTDPGQWYYDTVYQIYDLGLMAGVGNDRFAPDAALDRATVATVLYRMSNSPVVKGSNPYVDVTPGLWYTDPIIWATENGIVKGYGNGIFGPNKAVTREEMAAMIYRFWQYQGGQTQEGSQKLSQFQDSAKVSPWAQEAVAWCLSRGIINGLPGKILAPQSGATRAQVAQILANYLKVVV